MKTINNKIFMKIKCAWCGSIIGERLCDKGQQNQVSHGICALCAVKMEKEFEVE